MMEKNKRLLFIAAFVLISALMAFGLWYFFFRPLFQTPGSEQPAEVGGLTGGLRPSKEGTGRPTSTAQGDGQLPSSGEGLEPIPQQQPPQGVQILRDAVTQGVSLSPKSGGVRFYNPEDGRFYRLNPDGSTTLLSDRAFQNVENIDWGKQSDRAILEFPDGNKVYYDFETKRQVTLPSHWEGFDFSPDDDQIVAKSVGMDESSRYLIVSKPDGNEAKAIEPIGKNADRIIPSWSPNNQVISFSTAGQPVGDGGHQILFLGENHENFKSLIAPGRGFEPNWSPTGKQLLFSVFHERDEYRPSLWIAGGAADQIGENRHSLKLNTWADKCVWRSENELICAVPQSLPTGAALDRAQFDGAPDDIYRVDLQTNTKTRINNPDQIHPVTNPILSPDKKKLIFTDGVTGRLYQYLLPS